MASMPSLSPKKPRFEFIHQLQRLGYQRIVGLDEVGRGALAGPVVVAAVELPLFIDGITDSKLLTAPKRAQLDAAIRAQAAQIQLGQASNQEIDELGLAAALRLAYERALEHIEADLLLTDAYTPPSSLPFLSAHRGDSLFFPVAAASIAAKVYRDALMQEHHQKFPAYCWDQNVGYGTRGHQEAIRQHGPTRLHRHSFLHKKPQP